MALLAASALTGTAGSTKAQPTPRTISFTASGPDKLPAGFTVGLTGGGPKPVWSVIPDPSVPAGQVLAQTSANQTDLRFPLAIYESLKAANVDVSVRFKAVAGRVDQAAGIAIRLTDPRNYYVVRANALEDNVNFYRVANGIRGQIGGASVKVAPAAWHVLSLKAEGEAFSIGFNGNTLFTVRDNTFSKAGKIALWTKADSVTWFDALTVRQLS